LRPSLIEERTGGNLWSDIFERDLMASDAFQARDFIPSRVSAMPA